MIQKWVACWNPIVFILSLKNCPVFKVLNDETASPRGRVLQLEADIYEKAVFDCNLCRICEKQCPVNIKLCTAFRKARKVIVESNKEPKEIKEVLGSFEEELKEETEEEDKKYQEELEKTREENKKEAEKNKEKTDREDRQ